MSLIDFIGYTGILFVVFSISTSNNIAFRITGFFGALFFCLQGILLSQPTLVFVNILIGVIHIVKLFENNDEKSVDNVD